MVVLVVVVTMRKNFILACGEAFLGNNRDNSDSAVISEQ
jgi:hypothetical protein